MTRNDQSLYTGATSASLNLNTPAAEEVRRKRVDEKTEKANKRDNLKPAQEIVNQFIDDEIAEVSNIKYLDIEKMLSEEHFKSEMMARKKYVVYLGELKTKLTNTLREHDNG